MASDVVRYLRNSTRKEQDSVTEILRTVENEAREITQEEKAAVETHQREYLKLQAELERLEADEAMRADLAKTMNIGSDVIPSAIEHLRPQDALPRKIGDAFVASGAFKSIQTAKQGNKLPKNWSSEAVDMPWIDAKAAASPVLESNNPLLFGNGTTTAGDYRTLMPGIFTPSLNFNRLVIADLIPDQPVTTGNTLNWVEAVLRDQLGLSDMPIAEGSAKKVIRYQFGAQVAVLVKLAAYTKMSEELLEDAPGVAAWINRDIPFQIRQVEEAYLADKLYTGTVDASSLGAGATTAFDAILAAMNTIRLAGGEPDGMIIHPTDWSQALISKFGSGAGDKEYVGGGPFGATGNPWGLRVVQTTAATVDHPLIGDFGRGAVVGRKGGIQVSSTNTDQNDFILNLVTIRAEERLVAVKPYPEFFVKADISSFD